MRGLEATCVRRATVMPRPPLRVPAVPEPAGVANGLAGARATAGSFPCRRVETAQATRPIEKNGTLLSE